MRFSTLAVNVLTGGAALAYALPQGPPANPDDACCCCDISQPAIRCHTEMSSDPCICNDVVCPESAPTIWEYLAIDPVPTPFSPVPVKPTPRAPEEQSECCCCGDCFMQDAGYPCICLDVVCDSEGPVTGLPKSGESLAVTPQRRDDTPDECCCCDGSQQAIVCHPNSDPQGCGCGSDVCPPGATTIRNYAVDPVPTPFMPPPLDPTPTGAEPRAPQETACCCCDISKPAISCQMKTEEEGCFCAQVVCPPGAPTVWPSDDQPSQTPTPTPTPHPLPRPIPMPAP